MTWANIQSIIQTISVILAVLVATGTLRGREAERTAALTKIQLDIEYIKGRVSGYDEMRDRLIKVEQSVASAHRRIDEHLEREHGHGKEG